LKPALSGDVSRSETEMGNQNPLKPDDIQKGITFCLKAVINVFAKAKKDNGIRFRKREFDEV